MIIESLLDTDLYKFTMMQAVLHQFPGAMVVYRFKCRTEGIDYRPYIDEIKNEIEKLCTLRFTDEELEYLRQFSFFKDDFIDFLRLFQLNSRFIEIKTNDEFELEINGPWLHTILFEVPVLAIISEVYFRNQYPTPDYAEGRKRLGDKINYLKHALDPQDFKFSDFGTRRRFSKGWHGEVLQILHNELSQSLVGTSNVWYAKQYGLTPIGTMAHEYLQACQSLGPRLALSQKFGFERWASEYRGELGIALSDVYGLNAFLKDFDLYFCKLFDGARQDSGDPLEWGEAVIAHYEKHRIDPQTKHLVFSDNLNFELAVKICQQFKDRINVAFGIGTYLMNDLGYTAPQIVIKMTYCNDQPVAKISDSPGKGICPDESYLAYLRQVFGV